MDDNTIILDIEVNSGEAMQRILAAEQALADLKKEKKEADAAFAQNGDEEAYAKELTRITREVTQQKDAIRANTKAIQDNARQAAAAEGSLNQLRAALKQATSAYDAMSAAEREGAKGEALLQHIQKLTTDVTKAEEASGRFQRNVGNYKGAVAPLINIMSTLSTTLGKVGGAAGTTMVNGLNKATGAMNLMSKTPLIAVLGLLANLLTAVTGAFKTSQAATDAAARGMASFSAIGDGVSKVLQWVSRQLGSVVEWLGTLLEKTGLLKKEMEARRDLTEREIKLREIELAAITRNARYTKEIAELRAKAADAENYTAKERLQYLDEALKKEKEISDSERLIASMRYNIIKDTNAMTDSGYEDRKKEAEAEAAMYAAEAAYYAKARENNRARKQLVSQLKSEVGEVVEATASWEEHLSNSEAMTQRLVASFNEAAAAGTRLDNELKKITDTAAKQQQNEATAAKLAGDMREYYLKSIQAARSALNSLTIADGEAVEDFVSRQLEAQARLLEAQQAFNDYEVDSAEKISEAWQKSASAVGNAFGVMGSFFGQFAEQSVDAAKAEAAMSLAQTYIQQGVAIASGVAQAAKVPYPGNIAAIASVVAAIVSALGSTVSIVKKANDQIQYYAVGGLVTGAGSSTSDSIPARLSNGEFVVNAAATRQHLAELVSINGGWGNTSPAAKFASGGYVTAGIDAAAIVKAMTAAMEGITPVVSVKEITMMQNRIKIKEQ